MGQYYNAVVIAKQKNKYYPDGRYPDERMRVLVPFDCGETLKLFEISELNNKFARRVCSQAIRMNKSWMPPRMAVIGDYAEIDDIPADIDESSRTEAVSMVVNRLLWPDKFRYKGAKDRIADIEHTVALNHDKKEFVHMNVCPQGKYYQANPLMLLLAVGNGRGGGDYDGKYIDDVGAWAFDHIELVGECGIPEGYTEIHPEFDFQ